jgi:hypothetical protein
MKTHSKTIAAVLLAASLPWLADSALAAPIAAPSSLRNAAAGSVQTVQWRGRGWGGAGIGLAAGAIIGGAIVASQPYGYGYAPGYYAPGYTYAPGYSYTPDYGYAPQYGYAPDYGYAPSYGYDPGEE